jgi:hypothetical protein
MAYNAVSTGTGYVNLTNILGIVSQENEMYKAVQSAAFLAFIRKLLP